MAFPQCDFEIREAGPADRERVLQFLRRFFFRDEPCNAYLQLITDDKPINEDMESYNMATFDTGMSLLASHNGKLIGVCLCLITEKGKKNFPEYNDRKFTKLVQLYKYVYENSKLFDKFPESNKCITIDILSVDESYRGRGVAKALLELVSEKGKERGCDFVSADCSSHFTEIAVKRLGFEQIYSLNYDDYIIDGEQFIKSKHPHTAFTVYIKKID